MTFFTSSPASGWIRNFRLKYVELPRVCNFNRNTVMLSIMFYEIYFIKHYFFRCIHVNNFIMSQLRPTPATQGDWVKHGHRSKHANTSRGCSVLTPSGVIKCKVA